MRQWKHKDFCKMLRKNGYIYSHQTGSHCLYYKGTRHISVPLHLNMCIARRLIKENQLTVNTK